MFNNELSLEDFTISKVNSYKLKELKKGYKIPIVSDVMFHTMINNEKRKKYVCYLISLVLERSFEEIYNSNKYK